MELQTLTVSGEGTQQILFTNHALQDCRLPFHTAIVSKHWAKVSRDEANDRGSDTSQASSPLSGHQVTSCWCQERRHRPQPGPWHSGYLLGSLNLQENAIVPKCKLNLDQSTWLGAPNRSLALAPPHLPSGHDSEPNKHKIRSWHRSAVVLSVPHTTVMFWTHPLPVAAVPYRDASKHFTASY